jgi:hypothetical protein
MTSEDARRRVSGIEMTDAEVEWYVRLAVEEATGRKVQAFQE